MLKRISFIFMAATISMAFVACEDDYTNDVVDTDASYIHEGDVATPPACSPDGDATDMYPCGPYGTIQGTVFPNAMVALSHYHPLENELVQGDVQVYSFEALRAMLLSKGYKYMSLMLLASWCPHCQAETRALANIIDDHKDIFFLGVIVSTYANGEAVIDNTADDAQGWVNGFGLDETDNYLATWDPDHTYYFDYLKGGFPTNYLIDLKTMEIEQLPPPLEDSGAWEDAISSAFGD